MNPENPIGEPRETRQGLPCKVPVWLVVSMFLLVFWGMIYFDQNSGWCSPVVYSPYRNYQEVVEYNPHVMGPDIAHGREVFNRTCSLCHGMNGAGKPGQAPPLARSEWVIADGIGRLIRIPILGLRGPIEVNGQQYEFASGMTPIAPTREQMSDKDLGDVLSYIRQAWGNKASVVTAQQVAGVRAELGKRSEQASAQELKELPEDR